MDEDDNELNSGVDTEDLGNPDDLQSPEDDQGEGGTEETVIGFSDDEDGEAEETPLIKRLREQNRELSRRLHQKAKAPEENDPEPVVPPKPSMEEFGYDVDTYEQASDAYVAAKEAHAEWRARESSRIARREQQQGEQARQIEQQRRALGVTDYDERASVVHDRLSENQIAILMNAANDPARVIYALGRSSGRLDMLAGEDNLAKFAAMVGALEKDIKVSKRKAPAPETKVRGATAQFSTSADAKRLEKLEKDFEAGKITDRTEIRKLRAQINKAA